MVINVCDKLLSVCELSLFANLEEPFNVVPLTNEFTGSCCLTIVHFC